MIYTVVLSRRAKRALAKLPRYIVEKLEIWVDSVRMDGLEETKKIPDYHDEPLKGDRKGQRSIRLSKIEFVEVQEVNKHEY